MLRNQGAQFHCNCCKRDITESIRIKCAKCTDFDLCISCLASGREVAEHKKDHPYFIFTDTKLHIFSKDWAVEEEQLLLEAIQLYGLGNWFEVSRHVGTKTEDECEDHYVQVYIESPVFPLPHPDKILDPNNPNHQSEYYDDPTKNPLETTFLGQLSALTNKRSPKKKPLRSNPIESGFNKVARYRNSLMFKAGYMKMRNEFETEYDCEAEKLIANIGFNDNHIPWSKKMEIFKIFEERVLEREKRKQFLVERGLLDSDKPKNKFQTMEERDLFIKLKLFSRFHKSEEEHLAFCDSILQELRLKKEIQKFQLLRRRGFLNIPDEPITKSTRSERSSKRSKTKMMKQPMQLPEPDAKMSLSSAEKELCSLIALDPKNFLVLKKVLINEYTKSHFRLLRGNTLNIIENFGIDSAQSRLIMNFFVFNNWISLVD
ncbi:transcriptional adapter 2-alpha [Anaeramoeba ignava]|uniref:Transcriptional adapter 2-alpha n=1 Tax=Anaeramoeba ignava TaxID=1746090 RepID=A0A9Q0L8U9_ANAIG|nr:transcriptional adapter 2-alpha [Anaeramoeba ignava]